MLQLLQFKSLPKNHLTDGQRIMRHIELFAAPNKARTFCECKLSDIQDQSLVFFVCKCSDKDQNQKTENFLQTKFRSSPNTYNIEVQEII